MVVEALGHDWGEWEVTTEPTCTEPGEETHTCSRCGETETREIEPLGHTEGEVVIENKVEPTCTEDGGYDEVVYCEVCGEEISRKHVVVEATGHDWGEPVWAWSDNYTATATFTCKNDPSHVVVMDATITIDDSSLTYIATVVGPDGNTYTSTYTSGIPATGDASRLPLYIGLTAMFAAAAFVVLLVLKKKERWD